MRIRTTYFAIVALLLLPIQHVLADNSYGFNLDEATKILQAEQQKQQLRQQYHQKYQQRQRQSHQQKAVTTHNLYPQEQVSVARHVPTQPSRVPVPEADDLFGAATSGDVNSIRRLLSQGINVNVMNRERESALHMAAAKGHYSTVIYLINHGADINARTIKNWTPLHHAVRFRHANIANYLKQRGAHAHVKTSDGLSPIDMARATRDQRMVNILGGR